jgi:DNA-binding transcriptional ArsR family regulator
VDVVENVGDTLIRERVIPFEMTQPVVSRHLKVLASAGLIVRRVEGTKRPCRLAKAGVDEILADMKLENRREIR